MSYFALAESKVTSMYYFRQFTKVVTTRQRAILFNSNYRNRTDKLQRSVDDFTIKLITINMVGSEGSLSS